MASSIGALPSLHRYHHHHYRVFFKLPPLLPSLSILKPFRTFPPISCSLSSSSSSSSSTTASSSLEFNISFAPPKPKPKPQTDASPSEHGGALSSGQLFIPWIVRGEDGNLRLQDHPPARLIHALADAKTQNSGKNNEKQKQQKKKRTTTEVNSERPVTTAAPKWSKAARRFYNENFRASPQQRLSKVLAAAGVASRRSSEELIFDGKVTVNGSVCNTPQTRVDPARDVIYVNGSRLPKKLPPKHKINPGLPKPRLFTVGRLDVATTGLIIATNGDLAQALAHSSSKLSKEYIATVDGEVNKAI